MAAIHISLSAETVFTIAGFPVTNSIFTSLLVSTILIGVGLIAKSQIKATDKPTGLQNFLEMIVESFYGLVYSTTHDVKKTLNFLPFIMSFFLFIILNNWLGLLPGVGTVGIYHEVDAASHAMVPNYSLAQQAQAVTPAATSETHAATETISEPTHAEEATDEKHAPATKQVFVPLFRPGTADLNTTLALALVSQIVAQFMGFSYLGLGYLKKFINFSSPIMFFVGILEIISEFAKIISFAFRLFGNIFAGEVLLTVIAFLAPIVVPMPFYGLEIFVGFIQALVFSMLSLVFYNIATQSHESH